MEAAPLEFKPDMAEAARRWDAFHAGEMLDRPVVCVTAPRPGRQGTRRSDYRERVHGDLDEVIERALSSAAAVYYGGEAVPAFWLSFGPDEVAVFTGAELKWSQDSGDTNWSAPYVEDWEDALPLKVQEAHPLWLRMLDFYRRAAARLGGKMLLKPLDLHTNMDLLAAIRGPERLCLDLVEQPEMIDRAMADTMAVFRKVWHDISEAGRMDEFGYAHDCYSMEGAATLQCDFSCMISPEMARRWVFPALEEEAEIVKHVVYHWDGPGALVHERDLVATKGLHTLAYVPSPGQGGHRACLELFKRVQKAGKAVQVHGSPEEIKAMHKELLPNRVCYNTGVDSPAEAEDLLQWFVKHT